MRGAFAQHIQRLALDVAHALTRNAKRIGQHRQGLFATHANAIAHANHPRVQGRQRTEQGVDAEFQATEIQHLVRGRHIFRADARGERLITIVKQRLIHRHGIDEHRAQFLDPRERHARGTAEFIVGGLTSGVLHELLGAAV